MRPVIITLFAIMFVVLPNVGVVSADESRSFVAWNPDVTMVAFAHGASVSIMDADLGLTLNTVPDLAFQVTEPAWSPDGKTIAIANGKNVDIWPEPWDITSYASISLSYEKGYIYALAWNADGTQLAIANGGVQVWDTNTQKILYRLTDHENLVTDIAWSFVNGLIATSSLDRTIRIWDETDGSNRNKLIIASHNPFPDDRTTAFSVSWSPDGKKLAYATADSAIGIWEMNPENASESIVSASMIRHKNEVLCVDWLPDGTQLVSSGKDGTVRMWDVSTSQNLAVVAETLQPIYSVHWNPQGDKLAVAGLEEAFIFYLPSSSQH